MKRDEQQDDRKRTPGFAEKKIYNAPRLISYGDFRRVTLAKGGITTDNVAPFAKSKTAGGA